MSGIRYNMKNAEKFLLEIITRKISKNEACELYNNLIKPSIDMLMKSTSRSKDKITNILNILYNVESVVFNSVYLKYYDKSEPEESIADKNELSLDQKKVLHKERN